MPNLLRDATNVISNIESASKANNDSKDNLINIEKSLSEKAKKYTDNAISNMINEASDIGKYYTFVYIPKDISQYVKNILVNNNFYNLQLHDQTNDIYKIDWYNITRYKLINLDLLKSLLIPIFQSNTYYNENKVLLTSKPADWEIVTSTSSSTKRFGFRNYFYDPEAQHSISYNFYTNAFYVDLRDTEQSDETIYPHVYAAINSRPNDWDSFWDNSTNTLNPDIINNNTYFMKESI